MSFEGTHTFRGIVPPDVLAKVRAGLVDAPFADGRATANGAARDVKQNLQLPAGHPLAKELGALVVTAISRSDTFKTTAMSHAMVPLQFARYDVGMGYGDHLDLPVMGTTSGPVRVDLSLTVFLSDPDEYDGGELVIVGESGGELRVKQAAGDAFLYPAGSLHRVEPVTRGSRTVAVSWIQSLVRDLEDRELLVSLATSLAELKAAGTSEAHLMRLRQVQHRLIRRWALR